MEDITHTLIRATPTILHVVCVCIKMYYFFLLFSIFSLALRFHLHSALKVRVVYASFQSTPFTRRGFLYISFRFWFSHPLSLPIRFILTAHAIRFIYWTLSATYFMFVIFCCSSTIDGGNIARGRLANALNVISRLSFLHKFYFLLLQRKNIRIHPTTHKICNRCASVRFFFSSFSFRLKNRSHTFVATPTQMPWHFFLFTKSTKCK